MRGEGQRLSTHLKAAFAEIDRLTDVYRNAINKLETYALPNLSPQSAAKWFELYLRVVDLGVQIRRGEIRHRTAQSFTYPCMHKTGTRGAVHSGLSIDDCNSILLLMTDRDLVKEGRVSRWCNRIDGVDRDNVGELDKKLSSCLRTFIDRRSKFYDRLEVNGGDPHQKLLVLGGPGAAAPILLKVTRTCFGPKKCSCGEDAKPWENFCLEAGGPDTQSHLATRVTESAQTDDMGIMDIKRQMGFQELSREEENNDAAALAREAAELVRRRHPRGQSNAAASALRVPPSAKSIYQKKCEENGSNSKPHISAVLTVKNGAHLLDLSSIGFHSADDLQDLVDIFSSSGLPPVKVLDVSNGFFNAPAFKVLCQLLRLPQVREGVERLSLRGIAVPLRADFATIMRLMIGENSPVAGSLSPLGGLKALDLSFNTLQYEDAALLQPLLASLQRLESLSLESCFPEPIPTPILPPLPGDEKTTEESVRGALADVSNRLESLNFGSNYVANDSRWLDSLFAPGNTLQSVTLNGVRSSSVNATNATEAMEVDWQAGEPWDLQQVESLTWSSSTNSFSEKLLDTLSAELQSGFAQLKHLDVEITGQGNGDQTDKKIADTISRIADYAVLRSCRIAYCNRDGVILQSLSASVGRLLEDGLRECEVLSLRMPQLYLSPSTVCDLLSGAVVPRMKRMTVTTGISPLIQAEQSIGFQQMRAMQELTLELHAPSEEQNNACSAALALAQKLETSWLALGSSRGGDVKQDEKRFGSVAGKLNRSFVLSEQQKLKKRVYRCRFLTSPTP